MRARETDGWRGGPPSVLVTDGEQRAALAVVRSLRRAGCRVSVSATQRRSLAGTSRAVASTVVTPDPLVDPDAFVEAVASYVARRAVTVVLPVTEGAMLALLQARVRIEEAGATIPFGDAQAFAVLSDRMALGAIAADVGIAFPAQRVLCWGDGADALDDSLRYPVVIKPARSVGVGAGVAAGNGQRLGRAKFAVAHAATPAAFRARCATFPEGAYPLLVQERIVGPGVGVFLLQWDGRHVAAFAHRRLREKPPAGGVSVYAESVALDPKLAEASWRLLSALCWQGVAMVEYKLERVTGTPYLMEVNGRFWGSLQLALDAGVDFPALLVHLARGDAVGGPTSYRTGVRTRWWWGDVDHLFARLRRSDAALHLEPGAPSRIRACWDFFRVGGPRVRDAVFRASDPVPFLYETGRWFQGA